MSFSRLVLLLLLLGPACSGETAAPSNDASADRNASDTDRDADAPDTETYLDATAESADASVAEAGTTFKTASYASFVAESVRWMTTVEDANAEVQLGGSQGNAQVAVRNAMRNSVSWYRENLTHELGGLTNLGMCMSAYALKEAYPHVSESLQSKIQTNLRYLQRAVLQSQELRSEHPAQFAVPAKPGASQYSAKTNSLCGLALVELYFFWRARAKTDEALASYQSDALRAVGQIATFLVRMQNPRTLPGFVSGSGGFELLDETDRNADDVYDGIFEEINEGKLVPAMGLWSILAGRFFAKLADLGWTDLSPDQYRARAQGMKLLAAEGLAQSAEHYSPKWKCTDAACSTHFSEVGLSLAKSWNFQASPAGGGSGKWHGRFTKAGGLFENLNGSDPPQWAFNAIYAIDAGFREDASFANYFSDGAKQAAKRDGENDFRLLSPAERRDIFLGMGTYLVHGRVDPDDASRFNRVTSGTDHAHFVMNDSVMQIVTSNYGDNAVSGWAPDRWSAANEALWTPSAVRHPSERVVREGSYDFGDLSHVAHWAIELADDGQLHAKVSDEGRMTVSSENLASTLCRALRAWKGPSACTL